MTCIVLYQNLRQMYHIVSWPKLLWYRDITINSFIHIRSLFLTHYTHTVQKKIQSKLLFCNMTFKEIQILILKLWSGHNSFLTTFWPLIPKLFKPQAQKSTPVFFKHGPLWLNFKEIQLYIFTQTNLFQDIVQTSGKCWFFLLFSNPLLFISSSHNPKFNPSIPAVLWNFEVQFNFHS